jgi:predicted amidohydrolase YtcJ
VTTFVHATVFTGTGERDVASAFRIRDGRFTWVGDATELSAAALGRIQPGYDGSFLVLDRDPLTVPADDLDRVRVDQTWVRGEPAYRR